MTAQNSKNPITISRGTVDKKGGVVILPLREYEELKRMAIPTYQLKGKAAKELDKLVKEGLREHREGKTRKIKSLADLD